MHNQIILSNYEEPLFIKRLIWLVNYSIIKTIQEITQVLRYSHHIPTHFCTAIKCDCTGGIDTADFKKCIYLYCLGT